MIYLVLVQDGPFQCNVLFLGGIYDDQYFSCIAHGWFLQTRLVYGSSLGGRGNTTLTLVKEMRYPARVLRHCSGLSNVHDRECVALIAGDFRGLPGDHMSM